MKNYHITVNGQTYEVLVEEVADKAFSQPTPVTSVPTSAETGKGTPVTAPMPGTIIAVSAQPGATVKAGDTLCVLEAMKMENAIVAPEDGVVSEVLVTKGAQVEAGAVLVTL
ncbi:biotin carboxyl carrier protein [Streptococcus rupicaprae]|uniref:Biotin carboxyl carrier protein n=1 Tax=Streptococcus rupicaprae TaxID=759619 RepID=A0ABV2FGJ8_9STRE